MPVPPSSPGAVHVRVIDVFDGLLAARFVTSAGAVVSLTAEVVSHIAVEYADSFPTVSLDFTL